MGSTNQVDVVQPQPLPQAEEVSEVHVRNPNYKGKNYDPNFQAKRGSSSLSWQATTKHFYGTQPVQASLQQTNFDIWLKQQHATPQIF